MPLPTAQPHQQKSDLSPQPPISSPQGAIHSALKKQASHLSTFLTAATLCPAPTVSCLDVCSGCLTGLLASRLPFTPACNSAARVIFSNRESHQVTLLLSSRGPKNKVQTPSGILKPLIDLCYLPPYLCDELVPLPWQVLPSASSGVGTSNPVVLTYKPLTSGSF